MRSRKTKGTSRGSKRTRTVAKPKRTSAQAKCSAPKKAPAKSPAQAKAQTKTPPKPATKKVFKVKNEFRYNTKSKHKEFIFGEVGEKYKAVGITHSPKTFGRKNMPLKVNPQEGKTEQAYVRNGIVSASKKDFGKRTLKNHQFSADDYPNVKAKIRNYRKREKRRNKSKKE